MPDFRTTCQIHAAVFAALFLSYLLLPGVPLAAFTLDAPPEARFVARRAAFVFLGLAALLMLTRNAPKSDARQAIAIGLVVIWVGLAISGIQGILRGIAGWTGWFTVAVELALAALFLPHLGSGRHDDTP